jgi:dTMP kinase
VAEAKGILVSFEGIDGAGKTTLIQALQDACPDLEFVYLREPGGTRISEKIREVLLDSANQDILECTEAFLYAAARAQVVEECIRPALKTGKIVLMDRYIDSTLAYQGYGRGLNLNFLRNLNDLCTNCLLPDITFLLDLTAGDAQKRKRDIAVDRLESEGEFFLDKVRSGYLELAHGAEERFVVLDAARPVAELVTAALEALQKRLISR